MPDEIHEARTLHAQGMSIRSIARRLGCNVKTVRRALARPPAPASPESKLDRFLPQIQAKVQTGLSVPRILREIRELGYTGGRTILARQVRKLRGPRKKPRRVFRRFETPPGQEAQVDWSPYRVPIARIERRVHCFSMILAWSRMLFIAFYRNERLPTLIHAHAEAFAYFEGLTEVCVYDNMATVTLGRRGGTPIWNPAFLEFARHAGFRPQVCRVRDPNRKGKIERPFSYLEADFLRGRTFASWDHLNAEARRWLDTVANRRVHETTRRVPADAHREEKPSLIALPPAPFATARHEVRKVATDGYVGIDGSFYPAPASLVGQYVSVKVHPHRVEILDGDGAVAAAHAIPDVPCRLPADWSPATSAGEPVSRSELESRFLCLLPQARAFLDGLLGRMKALAPVHLRRLQQLVELYGEAPVADAVDRATRYRNFNTGAVARILQERYPHVIEEPPVAPLSGGPGLLGALDEVESGSLSGYDFESRPPSPPQGESDEEAR